MKAKKRINKGTSAFIIVTLIIVVYCAVCVSVEKNDLSDICALCETRLGAEEILPTDFSRASFYKNEFRGIYNGNIIMAEKKDGKWVITEVRSAGRDSYSWNYWR